MSTVTHPRASDRKARSAGYRADVDGLRAVAVLSVVAFHVFPRSIPGGFVGVDIFFVISGYLISGILFQWLQRGEFGFWRFYQRRIKRIFPSLILILVAVLAAGWFFLLAEDYKQLGKQTFSAGAFVSNFVLWMEGGYFDTASNLKPLMHLWSLGIEEQFYLAWPAFLYWCWKRNTNLSPVFATIAVLSFAANVILTPNHTATAFYFPITRFWELLMGSALAHVERSHPKFSSEVRQRLLTSGRNLRAFLWEARSYAGLALIAFALFWLNEKSPFPGWRALLPAVGTVMVISHPGGWINRRALSHSLVVFWGLISYPLYLWHWPILSFARILGFPVESVKVGLAIVLLSGILSWLSFIWIERPIRFGKIRPLTIPVLCGVIALVSAAGLFTDLRDGFGSRMPHQLQLLVNVDVKSLRPSFRYNQCLLEREFDHTAFKPECIDMQRPLLFLWGDSHAAALYPGLKFLQRSRTFGIAQLTSASCPPLLQFADETGLPHCKEINDFDIELIRRLRPATVLLHASWAAQSLDGFSSTVAALQKIGVEKILVLGPVPQWEERLTKVVWDYYREFAPHRLPPVRMRYRLSGKVWDSEQMLQMKCAELGVEYISLLDLLCRSDGCLTRIDENAGELTSFDGAHLSNSASRFVALSIAGRLFASHALSGVR